MRTLRFTIAYEGTDFHGWQYQPALPTVQGLLMAAVARVLGAPVKVTGASRTDAGVHALGQVASLMTASSIAPDVLARALNALLPSAIRVLDAREASPGFDARRSARGKRYAYVIDRGASADPFRRRYAWHIPQELDEPAMAEGLRLVRGCHDFSAFCAAAGRGRNPTCTVRATRVVTRRRWLVILISADSFLHHMVRNVVGSLVEVGRRAEPPSWISELIGARDRTRAGPTAPAHGLALVRVLYEGGG
jgi:tRNA pseudouridine38-40 synthase